MDLLKLKKFKEKKELSIEEELELFKIINAENNQKEYNHTNVLCTSTRKKVKDIEYKRFFVSHESKFEDFLKQNNFFKKEDIND